MNRAANLLELFGALALALALRRQLAEQRALIEAQQQQLESQAQVLDRLSQRLDELTAGTGEGAPAATVAPEPAAAEATRANARPVESGARDSVGDLNSAAIQAGDFPGSFKLPGTESVSLAIGGFVKTVAISDSDAEAMGADFTPALLGTGLRELKDGSELDNHRVAIGFQFY